MQVVNGFASLPRTMDGPMLIYLWLIAAIVFTCFAIWGKGIGAAMSWGTLSGNERRFTILRGLAAFCSIGAFAEAIIQATKHH